MSFMDKMAQTLNKVGEKTSEVANTTKTKMDIAKVKSNVDEKYKLLGELVYTALKENKTVDDQVQAYLNEIDILKAEIANLESQLGE